VSRIQRLSKSNQLGSKEILSKQNIYAHKKKLYNVRLMSVNQIPSIVSSLSLSLKALRKTLRYKTNVISLFKI